MEAYLAMVSCHNSRSRCWCSHTGKCNGLVCTGLPLIVCIYIYRYVSRSTYIYIYGYIYPYMVVASRWADLVVIIRALPAYLVRNPHPYMFIYMHKHVRMYLHILHILYSRFSTWLGPGQSAQPGLGKTLQLSTNRSKSMFDLFWSVWALEETADTELWGVLRSHCLASNCAFESAVLNSDLLTLDPASLTASNCAFYDFTGAVRRTMRI
jgi:hypothetical protein